MTGNQFEPTRFANIRAIAGTKNQYIGHGGGYQWRIGRSNDGRFVAHAKTSPGSAEYIIADTLAQLSRDLADKNPIRK